jgi:hypothetical protein
MVPLNLADSRYQHSIFYFIYFIIIPILLSLLFFFNFSRDIADPSHFTFIPIRLEAVTIHPRPRRRIIRRASTGHKPL